MEREVGEGFLLGEVTRYASQRGFLVGKAVASGFEAVVSGGFQVEVFESEFRKLIMEKHIHVWGRIPQHRREKALL